MFPLGSAPSRFKDHVIFPIAQKKEKDAKKVNVICNETPKTFVKEFGSIGVICFPDVRAADRCSKSKCCFHLLYLARTVNRYQRIVGFFH